MRIVSAKDYSRAELQRRTQSGRLQRVATGIYSEDTDRSPEEIVARDWRAIVATVMPDAVISYASAFTSLPHHGELDVAHTRRTPLLLPGLTVRSDGVGRRDDDDIPLGGGLFTASVARALIDNSEDHPGRPNRKVTRLTREQLHDQVVTLVQEMAPRRVDAIVDQVRRRAAPAVGAGIAAFVAAARAEVDTVPTTSRAMSAAQRAEGYDRQRLDVFRQVIGRLLELAPIRRLDGVPAVSRYLPFFEAYFSNYIEGTEFTIAEAESVVFDGVDLGRPEDAHDVVGTWKVADSPDMRVPVADADDFLERLLARHATMMGGRPAALPGRWKYRANRVGSTEFVAPDLVPGTLRAGWDEGQALTDPFQRAAYIMFVVSETHPFLDGNGRSARLAMNNELAPNGLHRVVIPVILRLDYLSALRRVTHYANPDALHRVLDHAQHWVQRGDWSSVAAGADYLNRTNALLDAREAEERRLHLEVPRWSATGSRTEFNR